MAELFDPLQDAPKDQLLLGLHCFIWCRITSSSDLNDEFDSWLVLQFGDFYEGIILLIYDGLWCIEYGLLVVY